MDGDVRRRPSYGVYVSQLIRFARVCSHVEDFNACNKCFTANFSNRVIGIISLESYELISKFNVGLNSLLHQGLSEPEFYGELAHKLKKIMRRTNFADQFRKIIIRHKRIKCYATVCMLIGKPNQG